MENAVLYNLIGIVSVFLPVLLLFTIGPRVTKRRLIFAGVGIITAGLIGIILLFTSIDTRVNWSSDYIGRLVREVFAAFTEEVIRYPAIILAQYTGMKYSQENSEVVTQLHPAYIEGEFTTISDPHGMALFFGTFYGMGETIAFYVYPAIEEILSETPKFIAGEEIVNIVLRITGVMAHIALTYLAMAITSQKGYWRVTILLHMASNAANRIFTELAPNILSDLVFTIFTRFAIVLIAYFLLRPRVRYLSPAVLIFLLTVLFLLIILISTFIALLVDLLSIGLFGN